MSDEIRVEIKSRKHLQMMGEWMGLIRAKQALDDASQFDKLPGFGLALAIVDREVNDTKARAITENLKACSRAGIDIAMVRNISLDFKLGAPELIVEMIDLADPRDDDAEGSTHDGQ